jgi:hypothetical protein
MIRRMEGQPEQTPEIRSSSKRRELSNEDARVWNERRPWPVRALTFLLALQAATVLGFVLLQLRDWASLSALLAEPETAFFVPLPALALLGFTAALGFLWLRPGAWVIAMLVQSLHLAVTLIFYFLYRQEQVYLFAMMFVAVVMVLYLNYAEVPAVFRAYPDEEMPDD